MCKGKTEIFDFPNDFDIPQYIRIGEYLPPAVIKKSISYDFTLDNNTNNVVTRKNRQLIYKYRSELQQLDYKNRINICGVLPIAEMDCEVWENTKFQMHYKNLMSCGSVWACPVCRFKIMSRRALEIQNIVNNAKSGGYAVGFLTLTAQHNNNTDFAKLVKSVTGTIRKILQSRQFRKLTEVSKLEFIRAFEITYSKLNGYHPHLHLVLMSMCSDEYMKVLADAIREAWLIYFPEANINNQVYVPVLELADLDSWIGQYIAKSNLSNELTNKVNSKGSSQGININPLNVGEMLLNEVYVHYSRSELIEIYKKYVELTKGLRSLTRSRGCSELLTIDELTDNEILTDCSELTVQNYIISSRVWKIITKSKNQLNVLAIIEDNRTDIVGCSAKVEMQLNELLKIKCFIDPDNLIQ